MCVYGKKERRRRLCVVKKVKKGGVHDETSVIWWKIKTCTSRKTVCRASMAAAGTIKGYCKWTSPDATMWGQRRRGREIKRIEKEDWWHFNEIWNFVEIFVFVRPVCVCVCRSLLLCLVCTFVCLFGCLFSFILVWFALGFHFYSFIFFLLGDCAPVCWFVILFFVAHCLLLFLLLLLLLLLEICCCCCCCCSIP